MWFPHALRYSDNYTLRSQMLLSFTLVTLIAAGVTVGISLGLLFALGHEASSTADKIILSDTQTNAAELGKEIAASISQQLTLVGNSVCKVSALYSTLLLANAKNGPANSTLLAPRPSFREYYFNGDCSFPDCPPDYGPIASRSRIPYLPGFINGSLDASSVYMYSSTSQRAVRNNSAWEAAVAGNSQLQNVIDGLAYQDIDSNVLYNRGPSTTVMFYLSAQVFTSPAQTSYFSIHRTYPGILKNDTAYDPSKRGWFLAAATDGIGLDGPYRETFTKQIVVTLSSRKTSTALGASTPITVVSAAVMLIQDVAKILHSVNYTDGGFGALIKYQSNQIIVWGNDTNVYNQSTNRFKTVADFDSTLATFDLTSDQVIEYIHAESGIHWIVTVSTLFHLDSTHLPALVMLVFARKHEALSPLRALNDEIATTTSSVMITILVIVLATAGVVMACASGLVVYLTQPLEVMRSISSEVVRISAEEPEHRDYSSVLRQAGSNLRRMDEAGALAASYYRVICTLHNKSVVSRHIPKNPPNPFHVADELEEEDLAWYFLHHEVYSKQLARSVSQAKSLSITGRLREGSIVPLNTEVDDLTVLALMKSRASSAVLHGTQASKYNTTEGDIELGKLIRPHQVEGSEQSGDSSLIDLSESSPLVGLCASIKSQLYCLALLLLAGMMMALIITIVFLADSGKQWTETSSTQLQAKQLTFLQAFAASKVVFVTSYFQQLSLDLLVGARVYSLVNDQQLNRSAFIANHWYLPSYSIDPRNPYHLPNSNYSLANTGYFVSDDADCFRSPGGCDATHRAYQTRLTSLLDIKLRSYFYSGNAFSFMQTGETMNGFTRYLPYVATTANSDPTSCVISKTAGEVCAAKYANSRCASSDYPSFPVYDARCRPWFELAKNKADPTQVYFQHPRISSSDNYVLTGVVPIRAGNQVQGDFQGALNANFLISALSDSMNAVTILQSGYSYLIDATNTSVLIVHPNASASCGELACAEDFNAAEWDVFQRDVLSPILMGDNVELLPDEYAKGGRTWRLIVRRIDVGSIHYALMMTVPNSEVLRASESTVDAIDEATIAMIETFVICLVLFGCSLLFLVQRLIRSVVTPINDLRAILEKTLNENYESELPDSASSLDMKLLLDAFSQLLVSLRFGSDSYAHGDQRHARQVFTDALHVFTATHNVRGIGKSLNNLAAVELAQGNFAVAEDLYQRAIAIVQTLLAKQSHGNQHSVRKADRDEDPEVDAQAVAEETQRLQRVLSDREGNLAMCYLERGESDRAFAMLERLLEEDKRNLYIKGCVVKQGSLGQYYLRQGDVQSAERVFRSALSFIRGLQQAKDGCIEGVTVNAHVTELLSSQGDLDVAMQIALYNMALLQEAKSAAAVRVVKSRKQSSQIDRCLQNIIEDHDENRNEDSKSDKKTADTTLLEARYLEALVSPAAMHAPTTTKILLALHKLFLTQHRSREVEELEDVASHFNFDLATLAMDRYDNSTCIEKTIAFVVDYSGSMTGSKIRSAVRNIDRIFTRHIHSADHMLLVRFNNEVDTLVPLTVKAGHEDRIRLAIQSLTVPNGGTALYDAVKEALRALDRNRWLFRRRSVRKALERDRWIVVLTDGQDNSSSINFSDLLKDVAASKAGLIVIGVGSEVHVELLQQLSSAASKGAFVFAEGSQRSVDQAFQQVAAIIHGQVLLEEY